jgi:Ulp1 family protease
MPDDSSSVILTSNSPSNSYHNGVGDTNADILLVYPFVYDTEIEKAAMQLSLCNYRFSVNKDYVKLQCEKAVGCNHIVIITQHDWNSLQSQSFVIDAIIEFWLLWIGRHISMVDSYILILGTHFYSQSHGLGGVQVVSSWLKNRCINVFSKNINIHSNQ